jgi:hypothetical protein
VFGQKKKGPLSFEENSKVPSARGALQIFRSARFFGNEAGFDLVGCGGSG